MNLSTDALKEMAVLSHSESIRKDMEVLERRKVFPFMRNYTVDVDAYIEFVTQYNEFINHEPKPYKQIVDKEMKL